MLFPRRESPPADGLPRSPAVARNRGPIADVLQRFLPSRGTVLEVASGTGEHAVFFAHRFSKLVWQPSDPDPTARAAIGAWRAASGGEGREPLGNLRAPLNLDVARPGWTDDVDPKLPVALAAINMVHISPWRATEGLFRGAARLLMPGRRVFLYGPFKREGRHTARSNASFDAALRRQDAGWGVRDLEAVAEAAAREGFAVDEAVEMPANNLTVVLIRR